MPGSIVPFVTLTAATSTGAGLSTDFGSAKSNITMVVSQTGTVTAGVVSLQLSQDGTNWVHFANTGALSTALGNLAISASGEAWRYARANITSAIVGGGSVSASIMAVE